jgi:hypothetical protein
MTDLTRPTLGRREWRRVPLQMPALLRSGRESLSGQVIDISVGGALFETQRKRIRFPGPCVLRLPVPTPSADHTLIPAQVVRAAGGRFGLRWTQRIPLAAVLKLGLPLDR